MERIKKIFAIIISLLMLSLPHAAGAADTNEVPFMKEGFEENFTWTLKNSKNPSAVTEVGVTTTEARSGTHAYIVTTTAYAEVELYKEFVIPTDGRSVRLSAWVKAESSSDQGALVYTYYVGDKDRKSNVVKTSSGAWEKVEVVIQPEATAGTKIRFSLAWYGTGTVYWDDVCGSYALGADVPFGTEAFSGTELFTDGDFETGENWRIIGSGEYTTETAHSNTQAMQLQGYPGTNSYVYQRVGMQPGAEYELRLWILKMTSNVTSQVKLEYYGTANNQQILWPEGTMGAWTECSFRFMVPPGTSTATILFRAYDSSMLYYDNVSLKKIKDPVRAYCQTDETFYYTDLTEGEVSVSVNSEVYPDYTDFTAEVSLADASEKLLYQGSAHSLASGKVLAKFPLTGMSDPAMAYTVTCTIRKSGIVVETNEMKIYRSFARPLNLTKDGTLLMNGEPFSPSIGYHVAENQLALAKSLGINVVQIPDSYVGNSKALVTYLDTLQKNGLYGLICLYGGMKPAAAQENLANTKTAVEAVRNHAAVFAYGIMDEPIGNACSEDEMLESYRLVRELDAVHPVYSADMYPQYFPKLSHWVDVMGIDNYPYNKEKSVYYVGDGIEEGVKQTQSSGKAVNTILQFFHRNGYYPTADEMRNMLYQSFFSGAQGIGYYALDEYVNGTHVSQTDVGLMLQEFAKEEQALLFDMFVHGKYPKTGEGETDSIQWARFTGNGKTYIAARSKDVDSVVSYTIDTGVTKDVLHVIRVIGKSNAAAIESAGLTVSLPPAGAALYEIASAGDDCETTGIFPGTFKAVYSGTEADIMVAIALYVQTENGVKLADVTFSKEGGASLTVPESGGEYSLKAFAWRNGRMEPISKKVEIGKSPE